MSAAATLAVLALPPWVWKTTKNVFFNQTKVGSHTNLNYKVMQFQLMEKHTLKSIQ
jgi:hypothetical protein